MQIAFHFDFDEGAGGDVVEHTLTAAPRRFGGEFDTEGLDTREEFAGVALLGQP